MIDCGERVRCYVHDLRDLVLVTFPGGKRCSDIRAGQAVVKRPVSSLITIPDANRQHNSKRLFFINYIITILNYFNFCFYPRLYQTWIWLCQIDNLISNK